MYILFYLCFDVINVVFVYAILSFGPSVEIGEPKKVNILSFDTFCCPVNKSECLWYVTKNVRLISTAAFLTPCYNSNLKSSRNTIIKICVFRIGQNFFKIYSSHIIFLLTLLEHNRPCRLDKEEDCRHLRNMYRLPRLVRRESFCEVETLASMIDSLTGIHNYPLYSLELPWGHLRNIHLPLKL